MATHTTPHFCNDSGAPSIRIGVSVFQCMGASPPHDHPHIFLDMGRDSKIICPYCSTLYVRDEKLSAQETEPPGCLASAVA
jgi:uncharacterized Zn-finger protein